MAQDTTNAGVEVVTLDLTQVAPMGNYVFLIHDPVSKETAVVDPPVIEPIQAALDSRGWRLTHILLTHHHDDHTMGTSDLRDGAIVIGAAADAHRLPKLDRAVSAGETVELCGGTVHIHDVSGHTVGHIAYHMPHAKALFSGDSLMACGCGRLFEGTPEQMWASLSPLRDLPQDTLVYSGHEYTETNVRCALTLEPDNEALILRSNATTQARAKGEPTVPASLALEIATNPFLRADTPQLQQAMGMVGAPAEAVFAKARSIRDTF